MEQKLLDLLVESIFFACQLLAPQDNDWLATATNALNLLSSHPRLGILVPATFHNFETLLNHALVKDWMPDVNGYKASKALNPSLLTAKQQASSLGTNDHWKHSAIKVGLPMPYEKKVVEKIDPVLLIVDKVEKGKDMVQVGKAQVAAVEKLKTFIQVKLPFVNMISYRLMNHSRNLQSGNNGIRLIALLSLLNRKGMFFILKCIHLQLKL